MSTNYKTCSVPMCRSTTIKNPEKLFIHVPRCPKRRKHWFQLARRDPRMISKKTTAYFCEDHFDLPNDMENYTQYCIMGAIRKVRMISGCLPTKFQCQAHSNKRTAPSKPELAVNKRRLTSATSGTGASSVSPTSSDQETQHELSQIERKTTAEDLCRGMIEMTVHSIENNPRYYIGIPKECYFLVQSMQRLTKLPEQHIILTLKKIRLNTPFSELADQFGISPSYACKIFMKSVPLISRHLHPFIIKSNKRVIKRNLPISFRHKYNNIYCIIDCLEIEIQKPAKSVEQAMTWSENKKANTTRYLISCTPDGIIDYISPGYSGRITYVNLVQDCNFLDNLEPGISLLANRGFKHIEGLLLQKDITLIRPPSVLTNSKLSKQDAIKTKQIASLRIVIERVMRRLREFSLLKPHSVVNKRLLKYLDDCTVIACGLINLQDSLIKNT